MFWYVFIRNSKSFVGNSPVKLTIKVSSVTSGNGNCRSSGTRIQLPFCALTSMKGGGEGVTPGWLAYFIKLLPPAAVVGQVILAATTSLISLEFERSPRLSVSLFQVHIVLFVKLPSNLDIEGRTFCPLSLKAEIGAAGFLLTVYIVP